MPARIPSSSSWPCRGMIHSPLSSPTRPLLLSGLRVLDVEATDRGFQLFDLLIGLRHASRSPCLQALFASLQEGISPFLNLPRRQVVRPGHVEDRACLTQNLEYHLRFALRGPSLLLSFQIFKLTGL